MTEPPQKKRPNFTDEELRALIAAVISRKEILFSKFGGKIKFCDYRAIVKKKQPVKKNILVGLVNIAIWNVFNAHKDWKISVKWLNIIYLPHSRVISQLIALSSQ